jgi:hypothetical protein
MTVGELIEILKEYPQHYDVTDKYGYIIIDVGDVEGDQVVLSSI